MRRRSEVRKTYRGFQPEITFKGGVVLVNERLVKSKRYSVDRWLATSMCGKPAGHRSRPWLQWRGRVVVLFDRLIKTVGFKRIAHPLGSRRWEIQPVSAAYHGL